MKIPQSLSGKAFRIALGQYWMVLAGTGVALLLVTVGLTFAINALTAQAAESQDDASWTALDDFPAINGNSDARLRPLVSPAQQNVSGRVTLAPSAQSTATIPASFAPRIVPPIAQEIPAPIDPDAMDWLEKLGQAEPKGLKELLAHLDHKYSQVRLRAIVRLGKMGTAAREAVPALARFLADPDKVTKEAAGTALARIGPVSVPVLIQELKNPVAPNVVRAAHNLALIGPEAGDAVPVLTDCLKHKDGDIRAMAAHALGEIGPASSKAAASLTLLLGDTNKEVRKQARAALASIGPRAIPALRGALRSPVNQIRRQTADLLARQGSKSRVATGDLIALLTDMQPAVRKSAALALAAIGPDAGEASDALVNCAQDADASVRAASAVALGEIRAQGKAIGTLVNLFRDPIHNVRLQAVAAIIKIGPSALNVLINTIPHENMHMRTSAIFALGEIGPNAGDAVALLIDQLDDKLPLIRDQSALALGKIGPRAAAKAVEPLKDSIQKEMDIPVRISMRLALVQLLPGNRDVSQQLNQDVIGSVLGTNQALVNQTLLSVMRPKTPMEILKQKKIQGVLDFYTFRNSFRFGDGLDRWSHKLLQSLGPEAIPAMVDTLNRDNLIGGKEGFLVGGMQVSGGLFATGHPPPGPINVFFQ